MRDGSLRRQERHPVAVTIQKKFELRVESIECNVVTRSSIVCNGDYKPAPTAELSEYASMLHFHNISRLTW
jgi:hypothetical protein